MSLAGLQFIENITIGDSLAYWRRVIFNRIFGLLAIVCIPVYFTSIYLCIQANLYSMAVFDTIVYAILLFIIYDKNLTDRARFNIGCMLAFSIGLGFLIAIGPSGAGFFWLFIFPPLTCILLGKVASNYAQLINLVSLVLLGIAFHLNFHIWPKIEGYSSIIWAVVVINFIATNAIVTMSIAFLLGKLSHSLESTLTSRRATVIGLAKLAEYRDNETGAHLLRMQRYAAMLATQRYSEFDAPKELTVSFIEEITLSSVLHDIGKVGIADAILLKPGRLTPEEFEQIKAHPVIGASVLNSLTEYAPDCNFIKMGRDIAGGHHEKWDGNGYPKGVSGTDIPLAARIVALVDVYDALTSPRCYKKPFSHQDAVKLIIEGKGKHFDPKLVESFMVINHLFQQLSLASIEEDAINVNIA
ncbi:HD-GYP domain-containing protein [Shewanella goraebulensis]|uniref:HD-GYP domain-containing protein n=1 Tax=Shewanella goraebulensis TaxID=3050637 RepID=UPI002549EEF7|nr:HD domain-containing phosphohydrolase [Shewanella goraebulensis]